MIVDPERARGQEPDADHRASRPGDDGLSLGEGMGRAVPRAAVDPHVAQNLEVAEVGERQGARLDESVEYLADK